MALDGDLADGHCVLAYARMALEFDWQGAESGFKRALELSPNHADAYALYGRMCASQERHEEAIFMTRRAQELDPLAHRVDIATALLRAGRYEEALETATRAIAFEPGYARGQATLAWVLLKTGRPDEGLAALERAVALAPGETVWLGQLGQAYALAGKVEKAREILEELEAQSGTRYVAPYHLAYVHTGLGQHDRAMDYLEQAFEQRAGSVYGIKGSFLFAPLRSHPRFVALLRRMHLA